MFRIGAFLCIILTLIRQCPALTYTRGPPGAKDCQELSTFYQKQKSDVYRIWPGSWATVGSFPVYCDMLTDGGGWTVVQRRQMSDFPKDFFYKTWKEYKNGFGDLKTEFWIGNDRLFALTNQDAYELRVDMWDANGSYAHVQYRNFWIENEDQLYRLQVSGYNATADVGDSLGGHSGQRFTTKDSDNDIYVEGNCAQMYKGGWWYSKCHSANLNGLNLQGPHESYADGIEWQTWRGYHNSLAKVEMKIRPLQCGQNQIY